MCGGDFRRARLSPARPGPGELPLLLDRVEPAPAVLTIAISSRALFDLEESHRVFTRDGVEAYARYQAARETEALGKGSAFAAVRKLPRPERDRAPAAAGGRGPPPAQQRERRAPGAPLDRPVRARRPAGGVRGRHGPLPLPRSLRRREREPGRPARNAAARRGSGMARSRSTSATRRCAKPKSARPPPRPPRCASRRQHWPIAGCSFTHQCRERRRAADERPDRYVLVCLLVDPRRRIGPDRLLVQPHAPSLANHEIAHYHR